MIGLIATSEYHNMNKCNENKNLKEENNILKESISKVTMELEFYKKIHNYYGSLVGNMVIKTIEGQPVWIDTQKIITNKSLLLSLDKDEDVLQWIEDINIKYKDNDGW